MIDLDIYCKKVEIKSAPDFYQHVDLFGIDSDCIKEIIYQLKNQVSIDEILDLFDKEAIEQYLRESKG